MSLLSVENNKKSVGSVPHVFYPFSSKDFEDTHIHFLNCNKKSFCENAANAFPSSSCSSSSDDNDDDDDDDQDLSLSKMKKKWNEITADHSFVPISKIDNGDNKNGVEFLYSFSATDFLNTQINYKVPKIKIKRLVLFPKLKQKRLSRHRLCRKRSGKIFYSQFRLRPYKFSEFSDFEDDDQDYDKQKKEKNRLLDVVRKIDNNIPNETNRWLDVVQNLKFSSRSWLAAGEKRVMELWNNYLVEFPCMSDKQLKHSLFHFAEVVGGQVVEREKLYNYFLLHFVNLFDFGLVSLEDVYKAVDTLQIQMNVPFTFSQDFFCWALNLKRNNFNAITTTVINVTGKKDGVREDGGDKVDKETGEADEDKDKEDEYGSEESFVLYLSDD